MASLSNTSVPKQRMALNRLWWVGLIAVVGSVVANLIVRAIVLAISDLTPAFPPLQAAPIAIFTAIGALLAVIAFAIVARVAKQPMRTYPIVAVVALILSIVPNILAAMGLVSFPMPNASALAFYVLIVFHILAAGVCVVVLTTMMQDR